MTIATYIRDQAFIRLSKVGSWKSMRKVPIPTLQADQLPSLGIYILRENMTPDGDPDVGEPRYLSDVAISFSVVDLASKPDVLDGSVDAAIDLIQDTLLTDGTFVSLADANGTVILNSVPMIARTYSFPNNGDTYYLECRVTMTFRYACKFEPLAPNLLRDVMVDVRPNDSLLPSAPEKFDIQLTG